MNLIVSLADICTAPVEVQRWFASKLSCISAITEPAKAAEEKPPVVEQPEEKPVIDPPSVELVIEKAGQYIKANGTEAIKAVLAKYNIDRARNCPPEQRAAFLADLAVA